MKNTGNYQGFYSIAFKGMWVWGPCIEGLWVWGTGRGPWGFKLGACEPCSLLQALNLRISVRDAASSKVSGLQA